MKNQLLLLAMVLVSVCLTKTLSHSIKNEATQKRTLSTKKRLQGDVSSNNILMKTINVNITQLPKSQISMFKVNIGDVIDVTDIQSDGSYNFIQCFKNSWLKDNTKTKDYFGQDAQIKMVKKDASDLIKITGSLELNISAEVATISGKAALNLESTNKTSEETFIVRTYLNKKQDEIDIDGIKEENLNCNDSVKITHVVTKIVRGKFFSAEIDIKSKKSNNVIKAKGELEAKVQSMPIGGKGDIEFNYDKFTEDYNFEANIKAFGGPFTGFVTTMKDFVDNNKVWFDAVKNEEKDDKDFEKAKGKDVDYHNKAISYTLQPIHVMKNFGDRVKTRTRKQQRWISEGRSVFNKMFILEKTMDYLLKITEDIQDMAKETAELTDIRLDLVDKKELVLDAMSDGMVDRQFLKEYQQISVTNFQSDDFYKKFSKKFKENQANLKDGKYTLSFDNHMLTTLKALHIEFVSEEYNHHCEHDKNPFHESRQVKMHCTIKSTSQEFDDKLTVIKSVEQIGESHLDTSCQMVKSDDKHRYFEVNIDNPKNHHYEEDGKHIIQQSFRWHFINSRGLKENIYCFRWLSVLPEYKDSDLPYFHILSEEKPINTMKYNQQAAVKNDVLGGTEYTWEIKKVNNIKKSFSIKSVQKNDRLLCMYNYKNYNSLVLDYVPDVKSHEECQWYKKHDYLYNVKHNVCIIQRHKTAGTMRDPGTILLGGNDKVQYSCATYKAEPTTQKSRRRVSDKLLSRRLLIKRGTSYRQ